MPLVSIIVPVYNAEIYISRCIESILKQSFSSFELILIDDGSKDQSLRICLKYKQLDNRIKVYTKQNNGVSSARNLGIEKSVGKYLLFIDADDTIREDTIMSNLNFMNIPIDADIIEYPAIFNYNSEREKKIIPKDNNIERNKYNIYKYFYLCNRYSVWSFFIKKEIIKNIRFNEKIRIGEDILFLYKIILNVNCIASSSKGCYYYHYNNDSAMHKLNKKQKYDTDVILINEMYISTKNDSFLFVNFCTPFFLNLYHQLIEHKELTNTLITTLKKLKFQDILKSQIEIKNRIKIIILKIKAHFG